MVSFGITEYFIPWLSKVLFQLTKRSIYSAIELAIMQPIQFTVAYAFHRLYFFSAPSSPALEALLLPTK
jgi:uncharacterized membrane protein